jgi:hypothetical protein
MVKNEADVIEAFVRHNLSFLDQLVVIDNDSADDTREILLALQREGLPITLFHDPVVGYFQAEKMTAIYRKVVPQFKPRFVFLLDADEFIAAPSREALYGQLRTVRPGRQAQYCWRTYIPAPTGPEGDASDPLRSITHRMAVEARWPKSIIVTHPRIDQRLKIRQGNHDVVFFGISLPKKQLRDIALAHFPVRSIDQITGKVLVGWLAYLERMRHRRGRRSLTGAGFQWKVLYDRILRDGGLTTEDLTREAFKYAQSSDANFSWPADVVHEPVTPAYTKLTAQPSTSCTTLQKVMRSIDKILDPEAGSSGFAVPIGLQDADLEGEA